LTKIGFEPLSSDLCIFKHRTEMVLLIIYVDDMLISAPTKALIASIREALKKHFELKELGDVKQFLGINITRDRANRRIFLSQEPFAKKILQELTLETLHPVHTPMDVKWHPPLLQNEKKPPPAVVAYYQKAMGSLNWLSTNTRPDLTQAVNKLCEVNSCPSSFHLEALKRLFRYLQGTTDWGITLGGKEFTKEELGLQIYADASFGDDPIHRFSTGGHVVLAGGGPVYWKSKKQTLVTLSSTEAEFINLTPAGQSAVWLANILREAGCPQRSPFILFTDSANAQQIALHSENTARTRHIDIRYKWVQDRVRKGYFKLKHVPTTEMVADGLTKPLGKEKFAQFVKMIGVGPCQWRLID
jgi:hypothetical protein